MDWDLAPSTDGMQIQFFHTDHLGTPLRMTDTQGRELWRARNDDWGAVRQELGETDQPIRFQGQWEDGETGLHYNRHRYYKRTTASYAQQDPLQFEAHHHFYAFADGSPTSRVDPLGLSTCGYAPPPPTHGDVARDTAVNAATTAATRGMSNAPGGAIAAGTAAAQGAVALGSSMRSQACRAAEIYLSTGGDRMPMQMNTCLNVKMNEVKWEEYEDFDAAFRAIYKSCDRSIWSIFFGK